MPIAVEAVAVEIEQTRSEPVVRAAQGNLAD
jgi:hypothetical protein